MRVAFDTENTDLLDESSIDYTQVPYKLRDSFKIHCIVCKDLDTKKYYDFVQDEVQTKFKSFAKNVTQWVGHNSIAYDHLVLKLALGLDYTVEPDTLNGNSVQIDDTMVLSKTLNPDRGFHSIDGFGKLFGLNKIDWRERAIQLGLIDRHALRGAEFKVYHPEMLEYCRRDVDITEKAYDYLKEEWGSWNFKDAYSLEKSVAEIITRQEHRGFKFDSELAVANLEELDRLMEEIRVKVEHYIPPKPATKGILNDFTPPATQFLKSGQPSTHIKKFASRVGAEIAGDVGEFKLIFEGKEHPLPIDYSLHEGTVKATMKDVTHLKEWLCGVGWSPTLYKEKDITCDSKKKKLTREKYEATVERYVEQTLASNFCKDRCEQLKTTPERLRETLLDHDTKKPLRVLTNPCFTIDQEKNLCPHLEVLGDTFPYARDVANWLTYNHRRNSILGGGADYDEEEDAEKGFLSYVRKDGRIPTPADTCGAGSTRFKHRVVANIPRVTTLYGKNMRAMFGAGEGTYQLGADFNSLEAVVEGHFVWKYAGGPEYAKALVAKKPNDFHSVFAKELTEDIVKEYVSRDKAKGGVKYGLTYGSQANRLAKSTGWSLKIAKKVFDIFWERAKPLKLLKDRLEEYWTKVGNKQFILGIDGRKIYTRSKHSLLNFLFQSSGVICAKRQIVILDRKLKDAGLIIDFFKESWLNREYVQQMIAYHK